VRRGTILQPSFYPPDDLHRIHENNTLCLVLTFLPYHMSSIFPTLLSILPISLPQTLRFLYPYIEALTVPPRHTIVYTASHDTSFLTVFNGHVLDLCRSGYHFPAICSFWATINTESVVAALDRSRSDRYKVQDLILRIMPILNEGLAMETIPDLQVGCYMILTVLATKVTLSDTVLNAAMEAVVTSWSQTTPPGLICLATLAQQREAATLPSKVLRALLALEKLEEDLLLLKTQHGIDNITLGVLLGLLEKLGQSRDSHYLGLVRSLLGSELMDNSNITVAIEAIISKMQKSEISVDAKVFLNNLLYSLAENKTIGPIIKVAAKRHGSGVLHPKEGVPRLLVTDNGSIECKEEVTGLEARKITSDTESFEKAISQIPEQSSDETSFLAHSSSDVLFDSLSSLFILACAATDKLEVFSNLPLLRMPQSKAEPLILSFFIRFWCSSASATARAVAIKSVSNYLSGEEPEQDLQVLFPYVLYGLADPSLDVRRASTQLSLTLGSLYRDRGREANASNGKFFGREQIYGYDRNPSSATWLSTEVAAKFVELVLLTDLEESLLDPNHISKHLSSLLKGPKGLQGSENGPKELKASNRQAFFMFICGHTTNTPLYHVRYRLLQMLCQIERVGQLSRTKLLLPLLLEYKDQAQEDLRERCIRDQIEPSRLLEQVVEIVLPTDGEGVQILLAIIEAEKEQQPTPFCHATITRLRKMWPSIKQDLQLSISRILFEIAVGQRAPGSEMLKDEAIETLRTISLSTSILNFFLEACLELFKENHHDTYAPKRRRTSRGFSSSHNAASHTPDSILRRLTTTLELVEISKPEKHLRLMKGLFQILAELQNSRSRFGTEMSYLQVVALESIHAMVKEFEVSSWRPDSAGLLKGAKIT
jgi:U3 small nucleolar RNA-associated protein 10